MDAIRHDADAEEIAGLRGQLGVAVALLRECIGPLEVSAAVIESDDTEQMETLIQRAQAFVAAAVGVHELPAGASTETCGLCQGAGWLFTGEAPAVGVHPCDGGQQK